MNITIHKLQFEKHGVHKKHLRVCKCACVCVCVCVCVYVLHVLHTRMRT